MYVFYFVQSNHYVQQIVITIQQWYSRAVVTMAPGNIAISHAVISRNKERMQGTTTQLCIG